MKERFLVWWFEGPRWRYVAVSTGFFALLMALVIVAVVVWP